MSARPGGPISPTFEALRSDRQAGEEGREEIAQIPASFRLIKGRLDSENIFAKGISSESRQIHRDDSGQLESR